MKLASYIADGAEAFGVVRDDGVITMNNRFGGHAANLREALDGHLLPRIAEAARTGSIDHKLSDIKFLPVIPNPTRSPAPALITARMPARAAARFRSSRACFCGYRIRWSGDDPPDGVAEFRFRGRACDRDRTRRAAHRQGARARACRRLY